MDVGSLVGYLDLDDSGFDKGLDGALGKLDGFGAKGKVMAAAAGVAIGGAVVAGVVGAMNVEAANDKLSAQLGLSAEESERIGGIAGELYANAYGDSLEGVNGAVAAVIGSIGGMRDASSADLQAITANALDFATAMDVDVAGAATSAGLLVKTGLAADARGAFDLMTKAAQEAGPAMVEPLLDAANEYGTNFAAMGYTGEQAMALLVDASRNGEIALDKIGDATKEFAILAGTDLARTGPVYAQLGLDAEEMANKIVTGGSSAGEATKEIIDGLLAITDPSAQATAAIAFFGTPLEDLGVTQIPQFLDALSMAGGELENVAGAADAMGETLNDNASTNLESFKRQAMGAFVDVVGGKALPAVKDIAEFLADTFGPAVEEVTGFIEDNETAVTGIAIAVGAAALVYGGYAAVVGTVSAVTKAWAAGQAILNAVMAMNPVLLVVMAVAALAAGLIYAYQKSETFRDIVNGAFDLVKTAGGNMVGLLIDGFKMILTVWLTVADGIVSGAAKALGWIPGLGGKLDAANEAFDNMKDDILGTLDEAADKAYGFGEDAGKNVAAGVESQKGPVHDAARSAVSGVADAVRGAVDGAWGAGRDVGANAGQGVVDGVNAKRAEMERAASSAASAVAAAMRRALDVRSPSRVTMGIGNMVGEGLVKGMAQMRPAVAAEVARLADMQALADLSLTAPSFARPAAARSPVGAAAGGPGDGSVMGAGQTGNGPLVHADTINIIEGTPDDVARKLAVAARTGGLG